MVCVSSFLGATLGGDKTNRASCLNLLSLVAALPLGSGNSIAAPGARPRALALAAHSDLPSMQEARSKIKTR